jgi:lysophospholipase L1-like esterase
MSGVNTRIRLAVAAALCALVAIGVALSAPSTDPEGAGPRSGTGTRVAFYGDSYTLGTGASSPKKRWSTIVSAKRNWDEINPSVNGLGFITNRSVFGEGDLPSMVIDAEPEIVIVTMGLNDNFSYDFSATGIERQIGADFDRLHRELPDARIVVVEPFWYTDERPSSVDVIGRWVRDAAAEIGADYIPEASHWIEGHPEWMADDGLHPNDAGYAAIAEKMHARLEKLGL